MVKKSRRAKIRIPLQTFNQNWKVTIGSEDEDITSNLMNINCTSRSLRYGIGRFLFSLWNFKGEFNEKVKLGDDVKIYYHHETTEPTNLLFIGKVDFPSKSLDPDNKSYIVVRGRDFPELADQKITVSFSNSQADNAIKYIIDTWFSGIFTYDNLHADMTGLVIGDYVGQKAINVITDILKQVEFDGYIDEDRDINTYPDDGTNKNEVESIVHGVNMLPYSNFGRDGLKESNSVECYGSQTDGLMLVKTEIDSDSVDETWTKTAIVTAGSLSTTDSVTARAEAELTDLKRSEVSGLLSAEAGLPTLRPTQYIWCSSQYGEINDYYKAVTINHSLVASGKTIANVTFEKPIKSAVTMIRTIENSINASNNNLNNMDDTMIYLKFDNEEGITSLGNLEIVDGKLKIKSGETTGTMTTDVEIANVDVSHFEARTVTNDDCSISTFKVSNNGGASYNDSDKTYNLVNDIKTPVVYTTTGKSIRVQITLTEDADNPFPELDGFCLLTRRV